MLLSGLLSMVVLACSGLYIKGYIDSKPCEESDKYFDDDIVELGIQPHIVGVFLRRHFIYIVSFHFPAQKSTSGSLLRNFVPRYETFYSPTIVSGLG